MSLSVVERTQGRSTEWFDTALPPPSDREEELHGRVFRGMIGKGLTVTLSPMGEMREFQGMDAIWADLEKTLSATPSVGPLLQMVKQGLSDEAMQRMLQQSVPLFPTAPVAVGDSWTVPLDLPDTVMGRLRGLYTYRVEGEERRGARVTIEQLPAYSPDFNPIEHLWKKIKQEATHLQYFPEFAHWQAAVERALLHFAQTPREITGLMVRYCETLRAMAA